MPWLTLACLGVAGLAVPAMSPSVARLRRLGLLDDHRRRPSVSAVVSRLLRYRSAVFVAAGVVGAGAGIGATLTVTGRGAFLGPPALAAALVAVVASHVLSTEAASRRLDRDACALGEAVACLADELRAGQRPASALAAAAGAVDRPVIAGVFADAASAAALGGDVSAALRQGAVGDGAGPVGRGLDMLAASWAVSERSGAPLAGVLDSADADLRSRLRLRQLAAGQLAGPRATAVLLAGLPVLGVALAASSGGRPLTVLLGTPVGQLSLLVGVTLEALGTLWSMRIIRSAAAPP